MNALALKILAMVLMVLDHIGCIYGNPILRAVGRLAFPLFAFLIANGFRHTHSVPKYALRLFVFALISEVPYDLFTLNKVTLASWCGVLPELRLDNVFFTLLIGLCFLWLHDTYKKCGLKYAKLLSAVTFFALAAVAGFISADYGAVGVAWVAMFGIFDSSEKKNTVPLCIGSLLLSSWNILTHILSSALHTVILVNLGMQPGFAYFIHGGNLNTLNLMQPIAALSLALILCYNGKSGMPESKNQNRALQYAFYAFYPLHLLVLYFVVYYILI